MLGFLTYKGFQIYSAFDTHRFFRESGFFKPSFYRPLQINLEKLERLGVSI